MQLYFYMCSGFQDIVDVTHLIEILLTNDLVLCWKSREASDGKLEPIPYYGEISTFAERAYHDEIIVNSPELVNSSGPRFNFDVIAKLRHSEHDPSRSAYITITFGGMMVGERYNYVTALIDFHTTPVSPDIESPYFEDGAQLILKLSTELYRYLKPWYGWIDYSPHNFLSLEAIRDRKELDTLYWVNFFGPIYVEKYSSSFFLNSPCWKKAELSDGGIFLQLSEFYTKPVNGKEELELRGYFSSSGISLYSRNPFDDEYE